MCIGVPMHKYETQLTPQGYSFPQKIISLTMKQNCDQKVNIDRLKEFEKHVIPILLQKPSEWSSLDIDYHPPRVERLFWDNGDGYRIYLHVIHNTDQECLFHKHNWPAALKQVHGSYEMGVTYCADEVDSSKAYNLPILAKLIVSAGSYYEMTQTDALHYVRPITPFSLSIMLTHDRYPEHVIRKEANTRQLEPLSDLRKLEILSLFKSHLR